MDMDEKLERFGEILIERISGYEPMENIRMNCNEVAEELNLNIFKMDVYKQNGSNILRVEFEDEDYGILHTTVYFN